jgi:hypothetical protein
MTKDDALDLALEVLERMKGFGETFVYRSSEQNPYEQVCEAIKAIKQARALDKKAENARELGLDYEPDYKVTVVDDQHPKGVPLEQWGRPAPVQEPVFCEYCGGNDDADFGLPTDHCTDCARPQPAAQRQWVGLTDEEKRQIFEREDYQGWLDYINAIEAKLKEKNT